MEDFISYSKIAELLTKALRDELTDEEREVLERWRHEASVHEAFYRRVNTPEFLEEHPQHRFEGEIAEAWGRLYVRHRSRRRRLVAIRWSVAAMVAIVLGGVALWQSGGESRPLSQTLVQEHAVIEPGSRQAELVLGNGRTVKLGEHAQPRLLEVDGAVIKMDEKRLEYREEKEVDRLVFNTLRIPRGGEDSILLSDGTKVFLNAESEMNYPVVFAGGERKVVLKGEAFFEVAEDKARPFVVSTGDFDVRVTGTQFNVRVYPDETPTATLAEGSIRLLKGEHITDLVPGEQARVGAESVEVRKVNLEEAIAWRHDAFSFKQVRLEDLLTELARWYDMEVFYQNTGLKDLHFTAWFKRSSSMKEVVRLLERTQKVKLEVKGKTLIVKPNK